MVVEGVPKWIDGLIFTCCLAGSLSFLKCGDALLLDAFMPNCNLCPETLIPN